MKRSYLLLLVALLGMGLMLTGCGGKKTGAGSGTGAEDAEAGLAPSLEPVEWSYEKAPMPAIQGSPDYRLVSFGFDRESALMKKEGQGACREALKKLADKPDVHLIVIGFADGIHEKANAGALGMRRAHATQKFLTSLGIDKAQIQSTSFGDTYSTARDFETIKQSRERKVEVWVLK
jgi:outer membrane protein OmpA-like peptidoglycan-associated protein